MDGYAERLDTVRIDPADLDRERAFEVALVESSPLAFRVAYSVLRHRQDAEDVAQEALIKAHRSFQQLRDRQRFRAWLVRMTWRLAIDRRRADLRRTAREATHAREQRLATLPDELVVEERAKTLWGAIDDLPEKL
jgi:RNA polymerase sigma-70 factor (ECF subfamily)